MLNKNEAKWEINSPRKEKYDCYIGCIVSYVESLGLDYHPVLLSLWAFRNDKTQDELINARLKKLLAKYCGIGMQKHSIANAGNLKKFVESNLKNSPILLSINSYECFWSDSYHKYKFDRYIVIVGLKESELLCVDFNDPKPEPFLIPIEMLNELAITVEVFVKFAASTSKMDSTAFFEELKNTNHDICKSKMLFYIDQFCHKAFAPHAFNECIQYGFEFKNIPLLIQLQRISDDRLAFANTLCIYSHFAPDFCIPLEKKLKEAAKIIDNTKNVIMKQILVNNLNSIAAQRMFKKFIDIEAENVDYLRGYIEASCMRN